MRKTTLNGFCFIVPVWGLEYTRVFLDVCLPSLMAPGNIPAVSGMKKCQMLIYTDTENIFEISEKVNKIRDIVDVRVFNIADRFTESVSKTHTMMTLVYRDGLKIAQKDQVAAVIVTPDLVLADNGMIFAKKVLESGKKVIYVPGIRLKKEPVTHYLVSMKDNTSNALSVSAADLIRICMKTVHPISLEGFVNKKNSFILPSQLYWNVEDQGVLARCFHMHPFIVHFKNYNLGFSKTIDHSFVEKNIRSKDDLYVVQDSRELFVVELTSVKRPAFQSISRNMRSIAQWVHVCTTPHHRMLTTYKIRINSEDIEESVWQRYESASQHYIDDILDYLNSHRKKIFFVTSVSFIKRKTKKMLVSMFALLRKKIA